VRPQVEELETAIQCVKKEVRVMEKASESEKVSPVA